MKSAWIANDLTHCNYVEERGMSLQKKLMLITSCDDQCDVLKAKTNVP